MRVAAIGCLFWLGGGAIAARQAMKAIENVVGLPDGAGDLALEAIAVDGRRDRVLVEFALTGRNILCFLVGGRLVGAGGDKRARANEAAQRGVVVAGESRLVRQHEGEG